jgi:hypothetical protein
MDWNENEHFVLVFMKMSVLKPKTGSINSGTTGEEGIIDIVKRKYL